VIVAEPGGRLSATGRVIGWIKQHVPTHESIESNRWLRPVAHRILVPSLWRFNRRSVPRGVALGLFSGVLFPFAHMGIAALLALPFRANVPTAVGTTLLNNPVTIGPLMLGAYEIGHWVLRLDREVPGRPLASNVKANEGLLHWLVVQGGPSTIVGLVIIALVLAFVGYFVTALVWRLKIARKWRRRHAKTGN
jgi:uncharacterized protein (DUF2062 family)